MAEMRGKFTRTLQLENAERLRLKAEHQLDTDAWNELMNNTVLGLQMELSKGLESSISKIRTLESALTAEKEANKELRLQLQVL